MEAPSATTMRSEVTHSALLRPITYNNGLLYPKGKSTLQAEIEHRRRAHQTVPFTEEEVLNTVIPVIECLQHVHGQGIAHGSVTPKHILVTEEEEIKLMDWLSQDKQDSFYYPHSHPCTANDDWAALGQILAQIATLRQPSKPFE